VIDPLWRNVGVAFGTLLASTATLLCCVLPAVLVSSFPQLVWLSEHKSGVFAVAGMLLAARRRLTIRVCFVMEMWRAGAWRR
jgi:hypothetical protein